MNYHKLTTLLAGNDDLPKIHKIYNTVCLIAMLFCLLAAVESLFASLHPVLILNNFFYSLILGLLYYLSRVKLKFGASRFLGIAVLLIVYTPILWIFNGGSASGIPYNIILFASFLTILTISENDTLRNRIFSGLIMAAYFSISVALILLEYIHPEIFYKFEDPMTRFTDTSISLFIALAGNYFILKAFIEQYYKNLAQINEYSKRLEELVIRDSMTNLYNHAFIISRLADEIDKAARYERPLTVMMIDIDYFKKINDTHGHTFGDEVIVAIAHAIQTCCRSVDSVARYGGDEFFIVLPETNSASARVVADRLIRISHEMQFNNGTAITISGGITQYQTGDTSSEIIERVDSCLYEAKKDGRNRINMV